MGLSSAFGTTLYACVRQINGAGICGEYGGSSSAVLTLDPVADDDEEGQSNAAEQLAGTHPLSAASILKITGISRVGNDVKLTVSAVAGNIDLLETSFSLRSGTWQSVGSVVSASTSSTRINHIAGAGEPRRFYRVRVVTP